MKKAGIFLTMSSVLVIFAGCQQSEQKQASGVTRKDRLVANANLGLKDEFIRCQKEIENQKNLVKQCQQEKEALIKQCQQEKEATDQQTGETVKWLMDELPADLLKQVETLTIENEELSKKLEDLQKTSKSEEPNQQ